MGGDQEIEVAEKFADALLLGSEVSVLLGGGADHRKKTFKSRILFGGGSGFGEAVAEFGFGDRRDTGGFLSRQGGEAGSGGR